MTDRYDASGNSEGQYQPGSSNQVLLNKLGIINPEEMDEIELGLLDELTSVLLDDIEVDQRISAADLCEWHRRWLGNVFSWAGQYRSVNMAKGDFQFATAHLIPQLMQTFEEKFLYAYTPCEDMDDEQLVEALANVHLEFILIHPFREGNGRLGRLLATIMALQAGRPPLDYTYLTEHKNEYIQAIHAGLDNIEPMKALFRRVLQQSVLKSGDG
jgi:cell filamentation protein